MNQFWESPEFLHCVVEYIGLSPSRFYLRECSRYFNREVSEVLYVGESDFFEAMSRKLVNPKRLRLRVSALSDSLISRLRSTDEAKLTWIFPLESALQGRSVEEFNVLGKQSLEAILMCSIGRMNIPIFENAMNCIEARGLAAEVVLEVLPFLMVQEALMEADALEMVKRMIGNISHSQEAFHVEGLLVSATQYRAERCEEYLQTLTRKRFPKCLWPMPTGGI